MARAKIRKKKIVKKTNAQARNLPKDRGSAFDGSESGDHVEIPSNMPSSTAQKSVVHTVHSVKSSHVLPEATPASHQRGRSLHVTKLTNLFSKIPEDSTSAVNKQVTHGKNAFLTSTPKENEAATHSVRPSIHKEDSASVVKTTTTRSAEVEHEEIVEPSPEGVIETPRYPRKLQQRTLNFYFYPVDDTRKWVKEKLAKPSPRKKGVVTKKLRAPTTDEMSEVLLWESPSKRKRTLRDLTDLEVAFTVFKHTVEEFSDCVNDRDIMKLIAEYEEYVEKAIVKKLQQIEDAKKMQEKMKKLEGENKALSSKLGSLIDRKIRLQNKRKKRRKTD